MTHFKAVLIEDVSGNLAEVDEVGSALIGIEFEHHEIHEGNTYCYTEVVTLPALGTRDLLLVTPNSETLLVHFVWSVTVQSVASVGLYEDTTTADDGAVLPIINRFRDSVNTSSSALTHTPIVVILGTDLDPTRIGSGAGGGAAKSGGEALSRGEFILKGSAAKYLFRVTSVGAGNDATICLNWYEKEHPTSPIPPP